MRKVHTYTIVSASNALLNFGGLEKDLNRNWTLLPILHK
ncbi:hypothetical protein T190607A01A_60103 [Tenacibaculum sp. 190524A05c]|uniref:Uncharacterized protein n=1 Tax=Tenacibaculum platacis TaxID=3137852 RepID=A0ABP1ERH6_9FLAO